MLVTLEHRLRETGAKERYIPSAQMLKRHTHQVFTRALHVVHADLVKRVFPPCRLDMLGPKLGILGINVIWLCEFLQPLVEVEATSMTVVVISGKDFDAKASATIYRSNTGNRRPSKIYGIARNWNLESSAPEQLPFECYLVIFYGHVLNEVTTPSSFAGSCGEECETTRLRAGYNLHLQALGAASVSVNCRNMLHDRSV